MSPIRIHTMTPHDSTIGGSTDGMVAEKYNPIQANSCPQSSIGLLVSVRDQLEARIAFSAAVDIVDLKEPRNGPLAPVDPAIWRRVAQLRPELSLSADGSALARQTPRLSAALGEPADAKSIASSLPAAFAFAKAGPSGCDRTADLQRVWEEIRQRLDDSIELVAVAYADAASARCVEPEQVFAEAAKAGMRRCLIDTFTKDGQSTLDHLGANRLRDLAAIATEHQLWWTLAGSITTAHLPELIRSRVQPNCIGVRGDVCRSGRAGKISESRVRIWQKLLAEQACAR